MDLSCLISCKGTNLKREGKIGSLVLLKGVTLSVGAKPMCQLRVGRKTKNEGGAKIKSLRVGFPNSRDR